MNHQIVARTVVIHPLMECYIDEVYEDHTIGALDHRQTPESWMEEIPDFNDLIDGMHMLADHDMRCGLAYECWRLEGCYGYTDFDDFYEDAITGMSFEFERDHEDQFLDKDDVYDDVLEYMTVLQYVFRLDGRLVNDPIVEVW